MHPRGRDILLAIAFAMPSFRRSGVTVSAQGLVGMLTGSMLGAPGAAVAASIAGVAILPSALDP